MCVLALLLAADPAVPLIVAANRDELFERQAAPPAEVEEGIVAGKDLRAGGTWLGVNRHGLFVAVTNRRAPARTPESFSRGLLALEALRCRELASLEDLVARQTRLQPVAGFNLVAVLGGEGISFHWNGTLGVTGFGPGLHVISNDRDLDEDGMPEKKTLEAFAASLARLPDETALASFLRSHEGERPICKHGETYGTVSSTIYVSRRGAPTLLYAAGPPCRTVFSDYSALLRRGVAHGGR
jgi:uncharacterized protein with NRDE domain